MNVGRYSAHPPVAAAVAAAPVGPALEVAAGAPGPGVGPGSLRPVGRPGKCERYVAEGEFWIDSDGPAADGKILNIS